MEENTMLNFEEDVILPEGFEEGEDIFAEEQNQPPTTETEPVQENKGTNEDAGSEPTTADQNQQTLRIKFNHEEREIGLEEAATLAQKGLAYDKAKARAESAEQSISQMDQEAKRLGYDSVQSMLSSARKSFEDHRVQELIDAGNTEAMARFLVKQEGKAEAETKPQEEAKKADQGVTGVFKDGEVEEFVAMYPGVTKIPPEVIELHKSGVRLSVAYERYQTKQAQEELKVLRQNQAAAAKAPISSGVTEGGAGNQKPGGKDPFLEGFDSDNW